MFNEPNRKIVGAFVVGLAFVAGAYTVANFGKPRLDQIAAVGEATAPSRVAIDVTDKDENGIEDWRDDFVTTESIIVNQATTSEYTLPTTLTGKMAIGFMENIVRAKNYGPFGKTPEQVVDYTVEGLSQETEFRLYETRDISIIENWTENDVKNYANAMAGAILNSSAKPKENELVILDDVLNRGKTERMDELRVLADGYASLRDTSLSIPVPAVFTKQHLDLINTYQAVHMDIDGMTKSTSDPAFALMRLKRYQDDALGLQYAMKNMYEALQPYSGLFTNNDPAILFAAFDDNSQSQ